MKKEKLVTVAIGKELSIVGELTFEKRESQQTSKFRYFKKWVNGPNSFPLSPLMPLSEFTSYPYGDRINPRTALPGPISDTAPDSWGRGIIQKTLPVSWQSWIISLRSTIIPDKVHYGFLMTKASRCHLINHLLQE